MAHEVNAAPLPSRRISGTAALLGGLIGAAALLRFSGLARQSLWVDEVLSMRAANRILSLDAASELFNRHGPLYFYVLAPALAAGPSEVAARIPSALLGVGLVLLVYLLGRDLFDRRVGLAAAAVAAFSPFALWYSQEVRYVSLYLLLSAISIWSAYRFLRRETLWDGAAHAASTILMLLSFPAGIFVCLGENLWALGSRPGKKKARKWLLVQALIGMVFLPWLVRAYDIRVEAPAGGEPGVSMAEVSAGFSRPLRPMHLAYPLFTFGAGLTIGPSNRDLHEDLSLRPIWERRLQVLFAVLISGALVLAGAGVLLRKSPGAVGLLVLVLGTSLLGPFILALFTQVAYNVRYTAGAFPAYLVLLGGGVAWSLGRKPWGWGLLAAFVGLTVFSLAGYFGNPHYFRDDNRGAARYIAARIHPGEPLVVGAEERAFVHYYRGPITSWKRWRVDPAEAGRIEGMEEGRFWVASNRAWEEPRFQEFLRAMVRCFPNKEVVEFPGYRIYVFRMGGERAGVCSVSYQRSARRAAAPEASAPTQAAAPP